MIKVSVVKCNSYKKDEVYRTVKKAVDLIGGIEKFVKKDQKVLLKPNLLSACKVEKRVTTDPAIVEAVIRLLKPVTKNIFVGDSPAVHSTNKAMSSSGIKAICNKHNVEIADFSEFDNNKYPKGKKLKGFQIAKIVNDVDVIINLPKFKTHNYMVFTGAVKNLYGCISGAIKASLHFTFPKRTDFALMLLDLDNYLKPKVKLNIMDAVIGMEGPGPNNGYPRRLNFVSASEDSLALDKVMCEIVNIKEHDVPILQISEKKIRKKDIKTVGDKINVRNFNYPKSFTFFDVVPSSFGNILRNMLRSKPIIDKEKCKGCEECVVICPAKTIKIINTKAHILSRECIRCYCCHEICPYNAIRLKKPILYLFYEKLYKIIVRK
jgi:uncharacterized protein (DUF362 family)/Pyruvate/2-oxoacid:ferredoxin oxidoreductase delta subunit